ncbi:MAG: VirE protein [Bacteroidaceae bacterium]|nr:VirE protein [Bacteroidaceae bacterium]
MFGIANNIRSEVRACTPDLLNQAFDSPHVARVCAEIEDALEAHRRGELTKEEYETKKAELKKQLPVATFHATFKNGKRKNDDAIPSGLSIYDLDHIANPRAKWAEIEARKEELGILLAHISPSLEGLRLVFLMQQGMTLAEAQAWMAQQLGDAQYDSCVKDYARCSFVVPRDYILFLDADALFADDNFRHGLHGLHGTRPLPNEADAHLDDAELCPESVSSQQPKATETQGQENPCHPCNPCQKEEDIHYPSSYDDIPYETIVETLEEQMGGRPEHGSRNNFIFSMACHLRHVCNDDAQWIARILPTYGEAREKWMGSIRSACARNQTKTMPRIMKRTLAICRQRLEEESEIINQKSDISTPPKMPVRLPPLIKLLVSKTPKIYRPAVAHAVFPALGAHLWKTYFRYIDNVEHEATLMCCLMAGTGAGKNCISEPLNHILKDIRQRDRDNLQREKEWKREMQSKGANKDKRQRPEGLVIQEIDPDMTNAAFVQRLSDAEERFLYTKMNEIDQFDALKTSARSKAHFQIMCLAFDPGNVYGQTRVGTGSVSERVCIRFNWNASTTIQKGQAYFRSVLTDGPISRINFCTIPERPIGSEMPVYGTYDASFDEELRPYIERLNKARGLIECRQARTLAKKLMEENADFARLSESRVFENLSFRANVIAFLKACVLYVAHGEKWDKTMEDFVRWSLQYDLWCKMKFFGEAIESQEESFSVAKKSGPKNLLDLLPMQFTREEAQQMRQRQGIRRGSVQTMLDNWRKRDYIVVVGEARPENMARQTFTKTETYLKTHPQDESVGQSVGQSVKINSSPLPHLPS